MLKDIKEVEILEDNFLNSLFTSANLQEINQVCKVLNGSFYLDSFNYFPINNKFHTFYQLFKKDDENSLDHFYTKQFYNNLLNKQNDFKKIKNSFVLGSSPADNYFTNLLHFFPRIFFIKEKKINLIIHRNLSNKFRDFIKTICKIREIEVKFKFVDDDFYLFENSLIPQFFKINSSIKIIKFFLDRLLSNIKAPEIGKRIYVRRENANYRKILNEADLIESLRKNGFDIINPHHFEIINQMKIFSNAEVIISPYGSNLSNIIFCKKGTKIVEISPNFRNSYEVNISNRYNNIANYLGLDFHKITADTVDVKKHSNLAKKYIDEKILNGSDYYKNMILKMGEIEELINSL